MDANQNAQNQPQSDANLVQNPNVPTQGTTAPGVNTPQPLSSVAAAQSTSVASAQLSPTNNVKEWSAETQIDIPDEPIAEPTPPHNPVEPIPPAIPDDRTPPSKPGADQPSGEVIQAAQPQSQTPAEIKVKMPEIPGPKGPSFFGYRPPKWAHDQEYVREHKGKGKEDEADTWMLYMVDRLLKKHA